MRSTTIFSDLQPPILSEKEHPPMLMSLKKSHSLVKLLSTSSLILFRITVTCNVICNDRNPPLITKIVKKTFLGKKAQYLLFFTEKIFFSILFKNLKSLQGRLKFLLNLLKSISTQK